MLICSTTFLFYFLIFDNINMLWFITFSFFYIMKNYFFYYDGIFLCDSLSYLLVFISLFVFFSSLNLQLNRNMKIFLWSMMSVIISSFMCFNGFLFYMLFEACFVLMFLFLMSWGLMLERVQASFYMFFYTLVFSLPFLILILEEMVNITTNFYLLFSSSSKSMLWVFMFLVFVVKLPLFSFHLWLPKAHVEAPTAESMLLAGVLLKLGGFGLIRFYSLVEYLSVKNNLLINYLMMISISGGIVMNCVCLRQTDLKILIAYSSVVHMSLVYLSAISFCFTGHLGCVLMMLAHGFISPTLFFLMSLLYNNSYTRSMLALKGSFSIYNKFNLFWFLGCSLNFGFPPFMSFFSEIFITMSLTFLNFLNIGLMILFFFLTGVYCVFMYVSIISSEPFFKNVILMPSNNSLICMILFFYVLIYPFFFYIL